MLIEPYAYVRAITIGLGAMWTIGGLIRLFRFVRRWQERLADLGLSAGWLRQKAFVAVLRSTVLDPVNLALMILLGSIWSIRHVA